MRAEETGSAGVNRYIARFPKEVREILEGIRRTIKKSGTGVEEKISYQIPAFTWKGTYLVYVAAYKGHIGLYPVPKGDAAFQAAVAPYRSGKGTLRFPLDRRIPLSLIRKIVKVRMKSIAADFKKAKQPG
jgi:uncharacterized protein YdhG (YjbR/CyaY superfamily)